MHAKSTSILCGFKGKKRISSASKCSLSHKDLRLEFCETLFIKNIL